MNTRFTDDIAYFQYETYNKHYDLSRKKQFFHSFGVQREVSE